MPKTVDAQSMIQFAKQYTKPDWAKLCANKEFVRLVTDDLARARRLANKILGVTVKGS